MTRAQGKHREFSLNQSVATLINTMKVKGCNFGGVEMNICPKG